VFGVNKKQVVGSMQHTFMVTPVGHLHAEPLYSVLSSTLVPSLFGCTHHPDMAHTTVQSPGSRQSAGESLDSLAVCVHSFSLHAPAGIKQKGARGL
jgi:hypothetical protein